MNTVACSENSLSVRGLSVGYGRDLVVRDVSFDVGAGEVCALLGLNGSGKTTLLKGICGLLPSSGGTCFLGDAELSRLHEKQRAAFVSFIPQRHSKLIGVPVLDAVLMGLNAGLGIFESLPKGGNAAAMRALEKMQIPHLASKDFSKLSEGQKQLVILSRALLQDTPVILMDEPDSSLDFLNRHMMLGAVRDMVHREGKACVITLHDPNLALTYCDKLVLLSGGEVVSQLCLRDAGEREIDECLSAVYGDIIRERGQ